MKIKKEKLENKAVFLCGITLFFLLSLYLYSEKIKAITAITVCCMILYYVFYQKNISRLFVKKTILYILYVIIFSVYTFMFSNLDDKDVFEFIVSLLVALLFVYVQSSESNIKKSICAIRIVSFVTLIGCILQIIFPTLLSSLNRMRMGNLKYSFYQDFMRSGYIVGFSFQTAVTAFYLTILILIIGCKWISSEKKMTVVNYIILAMSFGLLFMTAKRIFIALTVLIFLFVYSLYNNKHAFKIISLAIILIVILYFLLNNTVIGERLIYRMNSIDPTRGRATIYAGMFGYIKESPIMGKGLTFMLHGISGYQNGHNIYLQMLTESGMVGLGLLLSWMLSNIIGAIRLLIDKIKTGKDSYYLAVSVSIQLLFLGWGFTGNPLYDVYPLIIYMIGVGITYYELS